MYDTKSRHTDSVGLMPKTAADTACIGGGLHATNQSVTERPELAMTLGNLEAAICSLEAARSVLAGRLEPVLRSSSPDAEGSSSCAPRPVRCQVSDEIEGFESRIRFQVSLLADMLNRLAV